jgi:hypothetical protein
MNGPKLLEQYVGKLVTSAGAFFPGERAVFRGHDLHASLKDMDWLELYLFGITGRRFTPQQMKVLHAIWSYTSYPDARLWNNRVAALAGTARSTGNLGIAAALAVSEAQIYGGGPLATAIAFLLKAHLSVERGEMLTEVVAAALRVGYIMGFGRPITPLDERIKPIMKLLREHGLDRGAHVQLAFSVEKILVTRNPNLRINYAGLVAAVAADFGVSPLEFDLFIIPLFLAGMPPCYLDAADKPEGLLFPLPCRMMSYEGVPHRRWSNVTEIPKG